jgi:ubiquinone/menaquinone biosynthesis C-methylase UbiE
VSLICQSAGPALASTNMTQNQNTNYLIHNEIYQDLKAAKNMNLKTRFVQGCVSDLSQFPNETFDAVIDGNCFHCIIGPDRRKTLDEVSRVLRKDGVFYLSTMIGDPKPGKVHLKFDPICRCQIQRGTPYRYMAQKEEVLNELSQSGFVVIDQEVSHNLWWDHLCCLARKTV